MQQHYSAYTPEDFEVWSLLFTRQYKQVQNLASDAFLKGIEKTGFSAGRIPDFTETDRILESLTGWSLEVVPSIIPGREFFLLLNRKKFCATTWLRSKSQLDYLEEPDMFHDVFGHVPLLTNQHFCDFFHGLSTLALKHIDDARAVELLGRIYWFTIEFGLIRENGSLKIYGAGILSSPGETAFCFSEASEKLPYDVRTIFRTSYRTDVFQEKYFVISSFEELYNSLPLLEEILKEELAAVPE